jgi:hypothetical protein
VSIVARSSAKAASLVQTREDKVEDALTRQRVRLAEQVQRSQSPVEAVQTQMLREPVLELVLALQQVSAPNQLSECAARQIRTESRLCM